MENFKDKTWLENKYINENLSAVQIAELCGCSDVNIRYWLKKLNIQIRTLKEAAKNRFPDGPQSRKIKLKCSVCDKDFTTDKFYIQEKIEKGKLLTCSFCSNSIASKEKWANRTKEQKKKIFDKAREGVIKYNQSLTPEEKFARSSKGGKANTSLSAINQWKSIRNDPEKLATIKKQRGKTSKEIWASLTPEQKNERLKRTFKDTKHSATADLFIQSVKDTGLHIEVEQPISGFIVDAIHLSSKTIVEFYGDFWHCNPEKYKDPEQYCSWLKRTVGQQWKRDQRRIAAFYKLGYNVIIIWESKWKENQEKELQRILDICS